MKNKKQTKKETNKVRGIQAELMVEEIVKKMNKQGIDILE